MSSKVSVLTPVYNGEQYICRYLDSLLNQTYKNFEIILVNDGSIDKTDSIVKQYIDEHKNLNIKYIYQENAGQASAVKNGFKYVTGDYLIWPDSDDFMESNAIEIMVEELDNNQNIDVVFGDANIREEKNINKIIGKFFPSEKILCKEEIFEDYLFENNVYIFTGCYMIRLSKFLKNNPNKYIYVGRTGQNWQILLPALYESKYKYISKVVYNYIIRKSSHSHSSTTFLQDLNKYIEHEKLLRNTLDNICMSKREREKYNKLLDDKYLIIYFMCYCKLYYKDKVKQSYLLIKNKNLNNKRIKFFYLLGTNKIINKLYRVIRREKYDKN